MNVAIVHPFFDSIGGSEQITFTLLKILDELGHKAKLYSIIPPYEYPKNTEIIGVKKVIRESNKLPPLVNYLIRNLIPSRLKRLRQQEAITSLALDNEKIVFIMGGNMPFLKPTKAKVYVYCNSTFDGELNYLVKQFSGAKSIYNNFVKRIIKKKYQAFLSSNAQLIANSLYTQSKIKELFGKSSILIYPPVNLERFKVKSYYEKRKQIACVMRISHEKNPMQLIDVILKSTFPGEIGCSAKSKTNKAIYQILLEKTRNKNVNLYYNFPDLRVDNLLAYSKIYLQLSEETFGIAVIEAMATGCIPIVPNNSANIETVPFDELRIDKPDNAVTKIQEAMNGKYDYLLPSLKSHAERFSITRFKENITALL